MGTRDGNDDVAGEARDSIGPRVAALALAFLLLCVAGVITVWVPELRNDPGPDEADTARPGSDAYEAARDGQADGDALSPTGG